MGKEHGRKGLKRSMYEGDKVKEERRCGMQTRKKQFPVV
jgi:hypothetical protein